MSEPRPSSSSQRSPSGASRLLELVVRPGCPPRPGGGLLTDWYRESVAAIDLEEWCDPAVRHLGAVFESEADLATIEEAVVAFAQARAGSDHTAAEVAADVVALVRLAWPGAGHGGTSGMGGSMPSACSPVPSAPGRRSGWRSRRPSTASILARTHSAEVAVARLPFGTAAARTFAALVGTPVADQRA
jgi:hypothetical protein